MSTFLFLALLCLNIWLLLIFEALLLLLCVCVYMLRCRSEPVEVGGQLVGVGYLYEYEVLRD